jgi:hypothetical protein
MKISNGYQPACIVVNPGFHRYLSLQVVFQIKLSVIEPLRKQTGRDLEAQWK